MFSLSCQIYVHFLKDASVGICLTCVIIEVKAVFRYDYSIWSFLSVVSESDAAQKGLWSGQFSRCG